MAERRGAWRRALRVVLAAVAAAAALRGPLAFAGLPYVHHSDEPTNVRIVQRMAVERDPHPRYFTYPALTFEAGALALAPFVEPGGWESGEALVRTQTVGNARADRPALVAELRWVVGVLPGLVAVAAAGATAWLAVRRWWAAGLAAGLAALSPLDVRHGPQVTPNAVSGAASALAVLAAVALAVRARPPPGGSGARPPPELLRRYLVAGAAVGVAAAAKYNAVLSGVALGVAHLATVGRHVVARWWMLLLAGLAALAVFLALNPFALVDPGAFADGVRFESRHYRRGHPGSDAGSSLSFHLAALWRAFGPVLLLVPLGPLARVVVARRAAVTVLAFVVAYVGFVSSFEVRFARNLLPVTAPVAAAAALGAAAVVERLRDRAWLPGRGAGAAGPAGSAGSTRAVAATALAVAAVLAWPAVEAVRGLRAGVDDPWARAQAWLDEHVEPGSRVAVEPYGVWVDPGRYRVTPLRALSFRDVDWYREQGFDVLVAGEGHFGRFLDEPGLYPEASAAYRELFARTCTRFAAGPDGGRVLLLELRPCLPISD